MTRAFLFLLALLQQFMPPGMCLCQALNARVTTEQTQPVVAEPEPAGCSCCKKKQPKTDDPIDKSATPSSPAPCCPGVHADADQAVLSADPVECVEVEVVDIAAVYAPLFPLPAQIHLPERPTSGSPPLYVSLRTLLI